MAFFDFVFPYVGACRLLSGCKPAHEMFLQLNYNPRT
jgi:hypothetical protein